MNNLKLLIGGSSSKFFHLKEFCLELENLGMKCKLVFDADYVDGYPSRKISNWIKSNSKFKNLIKEFKPDVIFVDRQRHFGLEAAKTNIPLLVHLRGDHWSELKMAEETLYKSPPKKLVLKKWEEIAEQCFQGSRIILPICNYLTGVVKKRYPEKTVETLYQGISPSNWYKVEGLKLKHPCVGLVQSAVIWEKTKEILTLTKVLEKNPDVMFYWVGDGPYREKILPILNKYKNFEWLGSLEYPNKVREFLSEIDVYALISGIDMSPLTLLEAQLMEKPVIATNVGGIPELIKNNESGFLIEKGNQQDLIDKLSIFINDGKKRKQFGLMGQKFIQENFSWKKISNDFNNIIKRHLESQ